MTVTFMFTGNLITNPEAGVQCAQKYPRAQTHALFPTEVKVLATALL